MKVYKIFLFTSLAIGAFSSCKKEEPIAMLGKPVESVRPEVRVSLSNRTPAVEDEVTFTLTTWHKQDQIAKVEFLHKLYERFGVYLELQTTKVTTWDKDSPSAVVVDTIANNEVWGSYPENGKSLNDYFVTSSNAYVVVANYDKFKAASATFKNEGEELIAQLPEEGYKVLLAKLAYAITVAEYQAFFPTAPDDHFTRTGTVRTGISALGKTYLQENLTKELLIQTGFKAVKKEGTLHAIVTARVTEASGAKSEVSNEFQSTYQ